MEETETQCVRLPRMMKSEADKYTHLWTLLALFLTLLRVKHLLELLLHLYFHFPPAGGGCFPLQNQSFLRKTSGRGSALGVGGVRGLRNNLPVAIRCQMDGCTGSADRWQRLPHGHSLSWCLHVSSRPLGKQEQLACLSLLAGEYGACTPKFESRHGTWGEVGWKGPWSDPSLKVGPDSGWDQGACSRLCPAKLWVSLKGGVLGQWSSAWQPLC